MSDDEKIPGGKLAQLVADVSEMKRTMEAVDKSMKEVTRVLAGEPMPGIIVVAASWPVRGAIDALLLLAGASLEREWQGQILSVP